MNNIKHLLKRFVKSIFPFKSQKGQDFWVAYSVYRFARKGFFVELAAADGVRHSNSHFLEKYMGWNGICIEPNPYFYRELCGSRNCVVDNSVVSSGEEVIDLRIDNGQLGGIVADDADNNFKIRGEQFSQAEIIQRKTTSLPDLLDKYKAPKFIEYLSLDVEGSEERVIEGMDFSKYTIGVITIERPTPKVNQLLFDNGYKFVKNFKYDSFYMHNSIVEGCKLKFEEFKQVEAKDW